MIIIMKTSSHFRLPAAAPFLLFCLAIGGATSHAQQPPEVIVVDGRAWAVEDSGEPASWAEAEDYCNTLEAGGFADWRLPSLFELESLFTAGPAGTLPAGIELDDCCAWSSTNLVDLEPEAKGELPDPAMGPDMYYWGLLFPDGVRYYSMNRFPDGVALCTRGDANDA